MNRLQGKVALVTGSSRGLGRAIAKALSSEGAKVVVSGTSERALESTAEEIRQQHGTVLAFKADVTRWADVKSMADAAARAFGTIDILVNNAGRIVIKPFLDQSEEDWDYTMDVNAKGSFLCCKAVAPYMIKQKSGKIINISSQAGKEGTPLMAPYCASKHAVVGLTRALALELAPYNVNVNAVCPGTILDTDMRAQVDGDLKRLGRSNLLSFPPLGRFALPEDVAKVVVFLASEESSHMTAQAINVTGGETQA